MRLFFCLCLLFLTLGSVKSQTNALKLESLRVSSDGYVVRMEFNKPIFGSNKGFTVANTSSNSFSSLSGFGSSVLEGRLSKPIVYGEPAVVSYKDIETKGIIQGDLNDGNGNVLGYFLKELVDTSSLTFKGEERYVSADATGGGDGIQGRPWTLLEMVSNLKPGTRYNVKAGNYGNQRLDLINVNGSIGNPIIIEGYSKVPGDNPDLGWSYPSKTNLNSSIMPLLDGKKSTDIGFLVYNGSYITLKNFQLTNYNKMVYGNISDHIFLENIITVHGDRNIQIIGERSHDNVIVNCVGYNGGLHNFSIDGTESLVQDNLSYCDRNDNSTDYYYSVFGSDHVIRNNYSKRVGDLSHYGHGLSIHTFSPGGSGGSNETDPNKTYYNFVDGHTSVNIVKPIEFRHGGTRYNVARAVYSYGEGPGSSAAGGIMFRDNTSHNIVENSIVETGSNGTCINFTESVEIGVGLGHDNIIRNNIFKNTKSSIFVDNRNSISATGYNNKIYNNTFYNNQILFKKYLGTVGFSNCEFKNNIVYSVGSFESNMKVSGWVFENNNFYKGFPAPSGKGNVSVDPGFEDASRGNFKLKKDSKMIDSGLDLPSVELDYEGNRRSQGQFDRHWCL